MTDDGEKESGLLIGYKGVKYGLQKRKAAPLPKPAAFGEESSDEDDVDAQLKKQQQQNLSATKVARARAAALAEDSTVYEYDALYDEMQRNREAPRRRELEQRKPKYIQDLMQKAEIRKKEQDIAYERRLLKERKKDDHLYENKEAFLTSAYKRKLMEDKFWIAREKRMDAVEEAEDVTKKSNLSGFYQNLVSRNVAFASNRLVDSCERAEAGDVAGREVLPEAEAMQEFDLGVLQAAAAVRPEEAEEQRSGSGSPPLPTEKVVPEEAKKAVLDEEAPDRKKRRNDAATIASARERYLARKKAASQT